MKMDNSRNVQNININNSEFKTSPKGSLKASDRNSTKSGPKSPMEMLQQKSGNLNNQQSPSLSLNADLNTDIGINLFKTVAKSTFVNSPAKISISNEDHK
jgi:hypothetical protein